ncbi:hypothetical protein G6O69_33370 [Pseudenhygromyxa sp. WMMC2535]|uniref:hypothetical protein n=1 Tax=Pseudenhygromyxa sp. WMMC2535 TaxID=2712867 RepID=UPI0015522991|nr:hypothetical protein [Pseudenhygromyxa sp. WMMC2535]NVB42760.1 hypothetical protein [Pseudenhygromyxa sp. WMMC2535]
MVHRICSRLALVSLTVAVLGCQQIVFVSDDGGGDDGDGGSTTIWVPDDQDEGGWADQSSPNPETSTAELGDDDGDDGPPKLDVPGGGPACSLVDLLFVIDDSSSMLAEQNNLIASFDGFVQGIQENLDEANDYHVGVVTTDAYALNDPSCRSLGALVTAAELGPCGPWAAGRFITLADELEPAFVCAASVGIEGDGDERQVGALLEAVGPSHAGEGGCNAGFLRDDALLVVVLVSDEDDGGSSIPGEDGSFGEPQQWFDALVDIKGVETNVVMLGLIGVAPPNACDPNDPYELSKPGYRLRNLIERFSYGEVGDVCIDDYGPFFGQALGLIKAACESFTPVG